MKKLFIHAGFDKCGSSSIQTFLCQHEFYHCINGDKLHYAALWHDRILWGKELLKNAKQRPHGYRASIPLAALSPSPQEYFTTIGKQLFELLEHYPVIISREAWSYEFEHWLNIHFFQEHNIDVTFIFYIRPPAMWLNSAWWQWGAWSGLELDDWLEQFFGAADYGERIHSFNCLTWAKKVHTRLLTPDLLVDFTKLVGIDLNRYQELQVVANKSLPNSILRFYQTHRQFRPEPHTPKVDFIVEKYLHLDGKPDWILSQRQVERIIEKSKLNSHFLLTYIDADQKDQLLADQRFWDAKAFAHLDVKPVDKVLPSYEDLDAIAVASLNALTYTVEALEALKAERNPIFDNADLWRDLALHVEKQNVELALQLMKQAYKLRPDGKLINQKLVAYEARLTKKAQQKS